MHYFEDIFIGVVFECKLFQVFPKYQGVWWATYSLCIQTRRKSGEADWAVQGKQN